MGVPVVVVPKTGTDALLAGTLVEPKVEAVELLETFVAPNVDDVVGCVEPNNVEPLLLPNTPELLLKLVPAVEFAWPKILLVVGNIGIEVVKFALENKLLLTLLVPPAFVPDVDVLALEPNIGIEVVFIAPIDDEPPAMLEKIGIELVDANPAEVVATLEPKTDVVVVFGRVKVAVLALKLEDVPKTG